MTSQVKRMKRIFRDLGITHLGETPSVQVERDKNGEYEPLSVHVDQLTDEQKDALDDAGYGYREFTQDGDVITTAVHEYPKRGDDNYNPDLAAYA